MARCENGKHNAAIRNGQRQKRYGWQEGLFCSQCCKFVKVFVPNPEDESMEA